MKNHMESESRSVVSDSLRPQGLYSPWSSPGQNTGVGSGSLLQGIFLTQESNQGLLHCRQILYQLSYQGSPIWRFLTKLKTVTTWFCNLIPWLIYLHYVWKLHTRIRRQTLPKCTVIFASWPPLQHWSLCSATALRVMASPPFYLGWLYSQIPNERDSILLDHPIPTIKYCAFRLRCSNGRLKLITVCPISIF